MPGKRHLTRKLTANLHHICCRKPPFFCWSCTFQLTFTEMKRWVYSHVSYIYISPEAQRGGGAAIVWKDGITLYFFCFCFLLPPFFIFTFLYQSWCGGFVWVIYTALQAWPRKEALLLGCQQLFDVVCVSGLGATWTPPWWSVFGMSYYLLGQLMRFT